MWGFERVSIELLLLGMMLISRNLIVVESARGHCDVGFWDYAKWGIPVTLLTTGVALGILLLLS